MILTGCNSILDSDCSQSINLEVKFAINLEMGHYDTKAYPSKRTKADTGRYIMEIFKQGSSLPLTRFVATKQSILHGENSIQAQFPLSAAKYTVAAWVDYLDESDNFYDVTDLSAVKINSDYHGSNDSDNAFVGIAEIDLTSYSNQRNAQVVEIIPLECPFAKIRIIATDAEKFLMRTMANRDTKATDISTFTVRFTYPGFLPTSFNIFQNNPNDAATGVAFTSDITLLEPSEYLLGYDYVFVNGNESAVLLDLTVFDGYGDVINSVSDISIPVARSKVTTVRGEFLTDNYKPGVAIDPGYEGEIDIRLD